MSIEDLLFSPIAPVVKPETTESEKLDTKHGFSGTFDRVGVAKRFACSKNTCYWSVTRKCEIHNKCVGRPPT
jgi:hypothetical protein